MKKVYITLLLILLFSGNLFAITYKPFYIGESKCYEFMIYDQAGDKMVPNNGDVVTLTLQRTSASSTVIKTMTGTYTSSQTDYNYTFSVGSNETANYPAGNAIMWLELTNATNNIKVVIDVSNIVIKERTR